MTIQNKFIATNGVLSIHADRIEDSSRFEISGFIADYRLEPFETELTDSEVKSISDCESESDEQFAAVFELVSDELRWATESVIESAIEFQEDYERSHDDSGSNYACIVEPYRFSEPAVIRAAAELLDVSDEIASEVLSNLNTCDIEPVSNSVYSSGVADALIVDSFLLGEIEIEVPSVFCSRGNKYSEIVDALDMLGIEHHNGYVYGSCDGYVWEMTVPGELLRDVLSGLIDSCDVFSESGELCEQVIDSNGKFAAITADDCLVCDECCEDNLSEYNRAGFDESDSRIVGVFDTSEYIEGENKCSKCAASLMRSNVERLTGSNAGIVRMQVDNLHLSTSVLSAVREVAMPIIRRMNGNPEFTRELKRGLILEVMLRHSANLETYCQVMSGRGRV